MSKKKIKLSLKKEDTKKKDPEQKKEEKTSAKETNDTNSLHQLETTKKELENIQKKYLYLLAEFENYKKNKTKEISELKKYGAQAFASSLINILDIFDQALNTKKNENLEMFKKGIEMTSIEFKNTLKSYGIQEVPSQKGTPFDPKFHEALSHEDSSDISPGHILKIYRKAYKFHERLLRPAQVIVAKEKPLSGQPNKKKEETPSS